MDPLLSGPLTDFAAPVAKWAHEVRDLRELGVLLRRAFADPVKPPTGPSFVSLRMDILDAVGPSDDVAPHRKSRKELDCVCWRQRCLHTGWQRLLVRFRQAGLGMAVPGRTVVWARSVAGELGDGAFGAGVVDERRARAELARVDRELRKLRAWVAVLEVHREKLLVDIQA